MAQVFLTNLTSVWIQNDTLNTDPKAQAFKQVPELNGFPQFGQTNEVLTVESFNSEFVSKTTGNSEYGNMTISVNWQPTVHKFLDDISIT